MTRPPWHGKVQMRLEPYAEYKYFDAMDDTPAGRKTRRLNLVNRNSGDIIGTVSWYASWRQYCFFPEPNTVWSDGCLADVHDLMGKLRSERGHGNE